MTVTYWAHTPNTDGKWQRLDAHLLGVADKASARSAKFGASELGYMAGLLHDMGKFRPEFQDYLQRCHTAPKSVRRGEVPHAAYGSFFCKNETTVLWSIIAGHHAGIYQFDPYPFDELKAKRAAEFNSLPVQGHDFARQHQRPAPLPEVFQSAERMEVLLRMLFSCLVDADSEDTARHTGEYVPLIYPTLAACSTYFDDQYTTMFGSQDNASGVILLRKLIFKDCKAGATGKRGFYRLTAPTGSGKTLASLAFALHHVFHSANSSAPIARIIYAAPYTTIIDQTAEIYRRFLPPSAVLEHHSAVEPEESETEDQTEIQVRRREAVQRWEAPIVVTTVIQLLESLFSNRRSRCRKLHNIANSVILLDEAQNLPVHLLAPTLDMLRILVEAFGCTIVFCTATQPAFTSPNSRFHSIETEELVSDVPVRFAEAKRVEFDLSLTQAGLTLEEIADKIREQYETTGRVLVIVNTKKLATDLWKALKDIEPIHLSTLLHPRHRKRILSQIDRGSCCVISTQVVEAGIDLDFPVVFREFGPLDRIVQAAGRCNRNGVPGQLPFGKTFVFLMEEVRLPPGAYRLATEATRLVLQGGADLNANDPAVYETFFQVFYRAIKDVGQEIKERRNCFDYPEVAKQYRVISDETVSVLIETELDDEAQRVARNVGYKGFATPADWQVLQQFCVSVRHAELKKRLEPALLDEEWIPGLHRWRGNYDSHLGLGETIVIAVEDLIT